MDRRHFLRVITVTSAAATIGGCSSGNRERLIPYVTPIEGVEPGVSVEYATVCRECPAGCGMIARVRDGRAHKVEGNPDHPINRGKLCLRGQALLQGLYNPDRIKQPLARDQRGRLQPISWDEAERRFVAALDGARNGHAAWIGQLETGALDKLIDDWLAAVTSSHTRLCYEPYAYESLRAAHARVFGRAEIPDYHIARARMLLSFGADFLETWVSNVEYERDFSAWRQARISGQHRGRYVFIAPRLSLTGANADEWIPVQPSTQGLVAHALTSVVKAVKSGNDVPLDDIQPLSEAAGVSVETIVRIGREFAADSPSLALPLEVTATDERATDANESILRLNIAAGNVGRTITFDRPHALSATAKYTELLDLIHAMRDGQVAILFVHHTNPVYSLPPSAHFREALQRVPTIVSFSSYEDEMTAYASLVLPDHTPLESWGEYSPRPGINGLMQPVVAPVFDTRATGDVLLASAAQLGHDLKVKGWHGVTAPTFQEYLRHTHEVDDEAWAASLQRGGIFREGNGEIGKLGNESPPFPPFPSFPNFPISSTEGNLSLLIAPSLHFFDGRTANRPWAQEIPDPMAKAVWGSWVEIHPDAAARIGANDGDVLVLTTEHGRIEVPALISERVHPETMAIQWGQGHTHFGRYATGVGVNPIALLSAASEAASGALIRRY